MKYNCGDACANSANNRFFTTLACEPVVPLEEKNKTFRSDLSKIFGRQEGKSAKKVR
jgi:hypothetical protein